jgi:hypothetical protein
MIHNLKSFELICKQIPLDTFLLSGEIENFYLINSLKDDIREKVKYSDLNNKTHVKGEFSGFLSLIENKNFHHFLKLIDKEIKIIYPHNFIVQEAWGNICRKGNEVTEHDHKGTTAFCGILYLTGDGPGTFFSDYGINIEEKIGKFVLFHPRLMHKVNKIESNIERITVAFNMYEIKTWENNTNIKVIKNDI